MTDIKQVTDFKEQSPGNKPTLFLFQLIVNLKIKYKIFKLPLKSLDIGHTLYLHYKMFKVLLFLCSKTHQ